MKQSGLAIGVLSMVVVWGAACSSGGGGTGGGGGASSASSTSSTTTSTSSSTSTSSTSSTSGAVDCTPKSECEKCGSMHCADLQAKCCETAGCVAIIACGNAKNCNGVDCYKPDTCQQVIDDNGGPLGDATAAAQPLGACAAMYCPTCPGYTGGAGGAGGGG